MTAPGKRGGARPGAGRPALLSPTRPRNIRMTDAEWAEVQQAAGRNGATASEWGRVALLVMARRSQSAR